MSVADLKQEIIEHLDGGDLSLRAEYSDILILIEDITNENNAWMILYCIRLINISRSGAINKTIVELLLAVTVNTDIEQTTYGDAYVSLLVLVNRIEGLTLANKCEYFRESLSNIKIAKYLDALSILDRSNLLSDENYIFLQTIKCKNYYMVALDIIVLSRAGLLDDDLRLVMVTSEGQYRSKVIEIIIFMQSQKVYYADFVSKLVSLCDSGEHSGLATLFNMHASCEQLIADINSDIEADRIRSLQLVIGYYLSGSKLIPALDMRRLCRSCITPVAVDQGWMHKILEVAILPYGNAVDALSVLCKYRALNEDSVSALKECGGKQIKIVARLIIFLNHHQLTTAIGSDNLKFIVILSKIDFVKEFACVLVRELKRTDNDMLATTKPVIFYAVIAGFLLYGLRGESYFLETLDHEEIGNIVEVISAGYVSTSSLSSNEVVLGLFGALISTGEEEGCLVNPPSGLLLRFFYTLSRLLLADKRTTGSFRLDWDLPGPLFLKGGIWFHDPLSAGVRDLAIDMADMANSIDAITVAASAA